MKVFGRNPSGERLKRVEQSPNYRQGGFNNVELTQVMREGASYMKLMLDFFNKPVTVKPPRVIPTIKTDLKNLQAEKPTVIWFGHSSYLIRSGNFTVLVDPVFSGHASPFSSLVNAFNGTDAYTANDIPPIDLLLVTHDHYDHLDFETVTALKDKVKRVVTALGVGEHLEHWGYDPKKITELDWWESETVEKDIKITATPSRHFSGRSFTRGKTLWASFILNLHGYRIFIGGDSGYDQQFAKIGQEANGFDLAILESGQYGVDWPNIHMMPEETVTAARDLGAKILLPVHWGKFILSNHPWNDPPRRVAAAATKIQQPVVFPGIGEPYVLGTTPAERHWWELE